MPLIRLILERPLRAGIGSLAVVIIVLLSAIDHQDFHTYHYAVPNTGFAQAVPGAFYEVGATPDATPLCRDTVQDAVTDDHSRVYYNVIGQLAAPINAVLGLFREDSKDRVRHELRMDFRMETLPEHHRVAMSDTCVDKLERHAREPGRVVCVVEQLYYAQDTEIPFAIRFKRGALGPDDGRRGLCPLAGRMFNLSRLRQPLIVFRDLPRDPTEDESETTASAVNPNP
ncbi:MAG: hypothetical protein AAGE18_17360 [Pseudomonadota bacterium]